METSVTDEKDTAAFVLFALLAASDKSTEKGTHCEANARVEYLGEVGAGWRKVEL